MYAPRPNLPHLQTPMLRTLVVGAGQAGCALARDLRSTPAFGLEPVGFLDDDPDKPGADGLPVLGTLATLGKIVEASRIDAVVIAIPSLPGDRFDQVAHDAAAAGVGVRYLPTFLAALQRDVAGSDLRSLDVRALIGRNEAHGVRRRVREYSDGRRV